MSRIRVKICGITRPEDGLAAASAGADAVGLVFYPGSKRSISIETAEVICNYLPPFITRVGLFVNATRNEINSVLRNVNLDMLQFHGSERPEDCLGYSKPYMKAIRMKAGVNLQQQVEIYDKSAGILLDTYIEGVPGGSGETFNWDIIPDNLRKPLILAGGLNADNVRDAIRRVQPYAVDVSSGVESSVGIKDADKLIRFIQQIRDYT